jgi:hypothetical protein
MATNMVVYSLKITPFSSSFPEHILNFTFSTAVAPECKYYLTFVGPNYIFQARLCIRHLDPFFGV